VCLNYYTFWLQDAQEVSGITENPNSYSTSTPPQLESHKNLVDQCVKGEGLVQINVQIQTIRKRINIADVLKPTEAALAALAEEVVAQLSPPETASQKSSSSESPIKTPVKRKLKDDSEEESVESSKDVKPVLNWVLDSKFKREQARLKIPEAAIEWTQAHVTHWLEWAIKQFELRGINMSDWQINGQELCAMTHEEFSKKLPRDPGNVFWTHLQLLKECNFVSVVHKQAEELRKPKQPRIMSATAISTTASGPVSLEQRIMRKSYQAVKGSECE